MTGTRRGNRESTISQRPNRRGYWEAKVWMGTKPDGRPDRRHIERKSLTEVRRAVRELERARDAGAAGKAGRAPTVEEMLTRHLSVVLPQRGRAPRTIDDYWSKCRNDVFPRWGGQRIDRLLPEHIEDGYAEMLAAGHAPSHVRKVHAIVSSAFEEQVKRGNIARNPFRLVEAPALAEPELPALTQDQARAVLRAAQDTRHPARWSIGLACGLRQGEALGLRWQFVDFERGELRVWWQLQRLTWRHGCADPHGCGAAHHKTRPCPGNCSRHKRACPPPCAPDCADHARHCPRRTGGGLVFREIKERRRKTVKLPPELLEILQAHREQQDRERATAANLWQEHDLVFAAPDGKPIDPRADWHEWSGLLAAAAVPHHRLHSMRHSAATIAMDEGVALAVVQEMLGHSDIRMTRRYSHVSSPLAADAAARVGRALFGAPEGPTVPKTVPTGAGS